MGGSMGCWLYGLVSRQDPAGGTMWFDLAAVFGTDDFYLARVEWLPKEQATSEEGAKGQQRGDATELLVQLLDRRQLTLAIV